MGSGSEWGSDEYYDEEEPSDQPSALFENLPDNFGDDQAPIEINQESYQDEANDNKKMQDIMNIDEEEMN